MAKKSLLGLRIFVRNWALPRSVSSTMGRLTTSPWFLTLIAYIRPFIFWELPPRPTGVACRMQNISNGKPKSFISSSPNLLFRQNHHIAMLIKLTLGSYTTLWPIKKLTCLTWLSNGCGLRKPVRMALFPMVWYWAIFCLSICDFGRFQCDRGF